MALSLKETSLAMVQDNRGSVRKEVGLLVKLRHPDVQTFAEQFSTNLSQGGMFIRTRSPHPPGTMVRFEVQIAGGVRVLRGTAEVRWARQENEPGGAPGMGLQFKQLDAVSRQLIDQILEKKKAPAIPSPAAAARPATAPPAS